MDTMLSRALREFLSGPLKQLLVDLGGNDGERVEKELKKFLRREPCWLPEAKARTKKPARPILGPKQEVLVGGKKFYTRELLAAAHNTVILQTLGGLERVRVERADLGRFLETADRSKSYLCFIDNKEMVSLKWINDTWHGMAGVFRDGRGNAGQQILSRH